MTRGSGPVKSSTVDGVPGSGPASTIAATCSRRAGRRALRRQDRRLSSSPLYHAVDPGQIRGDPQVAVAGRRERPRDVRGLPVPHLEDEEPGACRVGDLLVEPGAEERALGLEAELRLEACERVDVRRIGDDEIPALGGGVEALLSELEVEPEPFRILARECKRDGRDVDGGDV